MRYNFGVQGLGFKVSPEGVLPLDGGMRSLLELGMKVAVSPRSFDSGRSCSGIRYLTYDVSRRSG